MAKNGKDEPLVIGSPAEITAARNPAMGAVRARVRYPIKAEPDIKGKVGKAWRANLTKVRNCLKDPKARKDATVCHWIIEAPWSHPFFHSYSIILIHLRRMKDERPVEHHLPGSTHEIHLYALNPDAKREHMLDRPVAGCWVTPVNFAAQFVADSDERAEARIMDSISKVCSGQISPDVDHQRDWAQLYGANMLRRIIPGAGADFKGG